MSEFAAKVLPRLTLVGLLSLGAVGCGGEVHERFLPRLDCGKEQKHPEGATFHYVDVGDPIHIGHTEIMSDGSLMTDATLTIKEDGTLVASDGPSKTNPEMSTKDDKVVIAVGDEQYTATAQKNGDTYDVAVVGQCVKPA